MIANAVPVDGDHVPCDRQQEDDEIEELILQMEDDQRQRDRGFLICLLGFLMIKDFFDD